ncbi:MAG: LysM peptidoglycan-binding domain-containing protein, partial [Chloroflexota bacterium]|nr:LysM peptidoglycan-binding domain-containing protein [Chloroflexota bacterium]
AGSAADRLAGGPPPADDDDTPWTASASSAAAGAAGAAGAAVDVAAAGRGRNAPEPEIEDLDLEDEDEPRRPVRRPRAYGQHLGGTSGPDWERPRRQDAYPTIKTRVGLPNVPRIVLLAGLVAVLAVALYFLPAVLGIGSGGGSPGAGSPSPSSAAQKTPTPSPTEPPAPTPAIYTIKKGETLSKIAKAHGITIEELLAANPTIKNADKISEGQQIILPVPSEAPPTEIDGSPEPSAP